ncbi:MAG TPA: TetR/AcrR family transcriptional regulator [Bacillota bacterium]|nr:TetR/AcrR family transcriptional regulator [Bacillota bacterium]
MAIDRKKLIINAATESFSQYGYKATTMDQVAKRANVGKGTIYTFFENKEELFNEIMMSLLDDMKKAAEQAIRPECSFKENVHQSLYSMLEFRMEHQLTIKLFQENRDIGTPIVQSAMEKMEDMILSFIKQKVATAINKGEIRSCDPDLTAFIFLKLYIALIFDWEKQHEALTKEDIAHLFDIYLLQGLAVNKNY